MAKKPKKEPVYALSRNEAIRLAKEAGKEQLPIQWRDHAMDRMRQRAISTTDVLRVLRAGVITEDPHMDSRYQSWKCRFEGYSAGTHIAVGVGIPDDKSVVIVITAIDIN